MNELLTRDVDLIRLAREIAIDHDDIDVVLDRYQLNYDSWRLLLEFPRFRALLANETEAWESAKNVKERVKLKAAGLIEGYLEEAQAALYDRSQTLIARTGLAKLVASFAGIGTEFDQKHGGGGSGGFSITINLGDRTLNVSAHENVQNDENSEFLGENSYFSPNFPSLEGVRAGDDVYEINSDLS